MAYRLQFRKDTKENWERVNPQLADGEPGWVRGTNLYKIGEPRNDGTLKRWNDLPYFGFNGTISDTLNVVEGEDTTIEAISKAVLLGKFDELEGLIDELASKESLDGISSRIDDIDTWKESIDATLISYDERILATEASAETFATTLNEVEGEISKLKDEVSKETISTLTQSEYDLLVQNDLIKEGVLYCIYEEND